MMSELVSEFLIAMENMHFDQGVAYVADDLKYINSPGTVVCGPGGVREVLEPFFAPIE